MTSNSPFKRIILAPMVVMGVLLMLLEEQLWDWLVRLGQWLGRLPPLRRAEDHLRALPPNGAAVVLFLPAALIFPVKVLAVWLMAMGHWGGGLTVLISAKLVGTALVARIYTLCEPALSQLPWFVRLRQWFYDAKNWAHRRLASWSVWQLAGAWVRKIKTAIRRLLHAGSEPE